MSQNEMVQIFIDEINTLKSEMSQTISKLIESKLQDKDLFEKFGQLVDRIYGTAMTLGHVEIGEYTKAMKDVTYMASASDNEKGHQKTVRTMIKYIELNDEICLALRDPQKLRLLNLKLNQEKSRVQILNRREFFNIDKRSCDYKED